jgi:hypothetical protein
LSGRIPRSRKPSCGSGLAFPLPSRQRDSRMGGNSFADELYARLMAFDGSM